MSKPSATILATLPFALAATSPLAAETALRPYAPGTPQFGTGGTSNAPSTAILRQDEDWSDLRMTPETERDAVDRLRHVPLSADGRIFASFGFDGRFGAEWYDDASFGDDPGDDGDWHLRANIQVGLTFGQRARLYGALKFGEVRGNRAPVPAAEDDGPDVHQAFAELSFGDVAGGRPQDAFVRIGRQELHYGSGRLISIRNGPNVRNDFDGILVRGRMGDVIADAFAFRPVEDDPGPWNNGTDDGKSLWGVYATMPFAALPQGNLDLFYIGFDRAVSPYAFQPVPVDETRHTLGARLWSGGPPGQGWGWDVEGGVQWGDARGLAGGGGDIRAGYLAGSGSYGWADAAWSPVVSMRFGLSSGDDDPADDRLGTFRAPFPPGRYFGESNPLGPGNLGGVGPAIAMSPTDKLTLTARYEAFWRLSDTDGIYAPPQIPLRGTAGDDRFVGHEIGLIADYAIDDVLSLNATAAYFDTGAFLGANGPAEDIAFVQIKLNASF
ncbi:alginate export family protein [Jannaschia sp. S6380]|uniref:alginate export family protein n=1 Tax=Jannaschia sp. S6380 TaxID=2926408 RepID=UPI001FF2EF03|nr:alginate export family protein [Jannaschia sp. S6380]MCK0167265.1 alginate export family protein [Jannaschia sp. S6380]